jgi:hypothetical protein
MCCAGIAVCQQRPAHGAPKDLGITVGVHEAASEIDEGAIADAQDAIDLTRFEKTTVIQNREGDDLVLDLSGHGTVRIVGYFTGNTPRLLFPVSLAPIYPLLFD